MTEQTINLNSYYYTQQEINNKLKEYISKTNNDQGFLKSDGTIVDPAYIHPNPTSLGGAKDSKLYKIAIDAQGHVKTVDTNIQASDLPSITTSKITDLSSNYIAKGDTNDILLANGTTKSQSNFATNGHTHDDKYIEKDTTATNKILLADGTYQSKDTIAPWDLKIPSDSSNIDIRLYYNELLKIVYFRYDQSYSFPNTQWNNMISYNNSESKLSGAKYKPLYDYRPTFAITLSTAILSTDNSSLADVKLEAYIRNDGNVLLKSSKANTTIPFIVSGMYPYVSS